MIRPPARFLLLSAVPREILMMMGR